MSTPGERNIERIIQHGSQQNVVLCVPTKHNRHLAKIMHSHACQVLPRKHCGCDQAGREVYDVTSKWVCWKTKTWMPPENIGGTTPKES